MSLFSSILPTGPAVHEFRGLGDPAALLPEEMRIVASAAPARRREFSAGRACARAALASLGAQAGPVLQGTHREPNWPDGIVGSITHCTGLAAAVVGPARAWLGLGIDVELSERLPAGVVRLVMGQDEIDALDRLPEEGVPWDRLVFSAKESVYKVWYPVRRKWLGFGDVVVHLSADGTFSAILARSDLGGLPRELPGQWTRADGFVATAIAIPRR